MSSQAAPGAASAALSIREARKRLGDIGHTKIYQLIAEGQLRACKLAGRTIILETDLQDLLSRLPSATEIGAVRPKHPQPPDAARKREASR